MTFRLWRCFDVAVDAIGPKTDFTLETNRKNERKTIQNPEFYLLDHEFLI